MDNPFDAMRAAVAEADRVSRAGDDFAANIARFIVGRLRRVPRTVLVELKRELRQFDAQQKRWKS